jgi:hypothetical protein
VVSSAWSYLHLHLAQVLEEDMAVKVIRVGIRWCGETIDLNNIMCEGLKLVIA